MQESFNSTQVDDEHTKLRQQIAFLESLLKARDKLITELGNELHCRRSLPPSPLKKSLIRLWDGLPRPVQKVIEPVADYIDKRVK